MVMQAGVMDGLGKRNKFMSIYSKRRLVVHCSKHRPPNAFVLFLQKIHFHICILLIINLLVFYYAAFLATKWLLNGYLLYPA